MAPSKLKNGLALLLQTCGWFALRSRSVLSSSALILMYHRVLPRELAHGGNIPVQPGMYVTPESFRAHLSWLKDHYSILSLTELAERLAARQDISHCVVLTFDDGWADNYQYAYPLLQEYKAPATIFLASGFIQTARRFWPEEVGWATLAVCEGWLDVSRLPGPIVEMMQSEKIRKDRPLEAVDLMIAEMKTWNEERRSSTAARCAEIREKIDGRGDPLLMNWDEVREMSASGLVDFGSHTVNHALLDQLPVEKVRQELVESSDRICRETGLPVELFAYPNGNYDPTVLSLLPETGIRVAVTTRRGFVRPDASLLELPRMAMHEDVSHTPALFQWRLFVR
jgi:peptidoglycan/xylan/chitin deacetylase (PgdA/CDA1 family)